MDFQNVKNSNIMKRIVFTIIFVPVAFVVIFFLWIPLLILVCAFLLAAFILRKKMKVTYFGNFGRNKNSYATWKQYSKSTAQSSLKNNYDNQDYFDAEYIPLDNQDEERKER